MVSQYIHRAILDQGEYNYETKEWEIKGINFKDLEPDVTLYFSSKKELSDFIYNYLLTETVLPVSNAGLIAKARV